MDARREDDVMKWFFAHNDDYKEVTDIFFLTIKDKCELVPFKIKNFKKKWRIAGGREGDDMRKNLIEYAFKNTEKEEIFVVCDTDIKFYHPVNDLIEKEMSNFDIVFQKEANKIHCNMGFMAMRNNAAVFNLWNDVYDISIEKNKWDQPTLNKLLYKRIPSSRGIPSWARFSNDIWNWSMGRSGVSFNEGTRLHHANCAVTKKSKIDQFKYVEDCLNKKSKIDFSINWMKK